MSVFQITGKKSYEKMPQSSLHDQTPWQQLYVLTSGGCSVNFTHKAGKSEDI